ncbi:MFS transporter [Leucobacter sp. cx-328]|uniref:MFS transporter n=1 Tax=unclassified Leucobacter TaxID=2621730 RepID=UPI00165D9B1D|nr:MULTISPECIES: MFS transporter [unclassified Leucobacter]MBC9943717.1 MFS transporter [Leucobacter sp. cx-328]
MTTQTAQILVPSAAPRVSRAGLTLALASAVLAFSMMQTLLVPALPVFAAELQVDSATAGWILTAYLLSGAIAAPVIGSLGDRFGHRRILILAMLIFVAGAALAAIATTLPLLLAGRVLQGAATASFPLAVAIVRLQLVGSAQATAIGWLSGTLGLGAGLALVVGGAVVDFLSWPWLFIVGGALGLLSIVLVIWQVPGATVPAVDARPDWAGIVLLVTTLLPLLLVVSQGASWGWGSPIILGLAVVAVISLVALVLVERRVAAPLVDPRLVTHRALAATNLLTVFLGFIPYVFYVGMPVLLQASPAHGVGHGLGVTATGVALLPGAILVFLGGRLTPWLLGRMSGRGIAALALGVMLVGGAGVAVRPESLWVIVVFFSLIGLGNGIGFAVIAELIAGNVPAAGLGAALGVNGVLRTVGSALGTPIATLVLTTVGLTAVGTPGTGTFSALFGAAAVVSFIGVIAAFLVPKPKPKR